jgi:hypothetical protein
MRNAYKISAGKPKVKRLKRRSGRSWEIKEDIKERVGKGMNWIHLAHDRKRWRSAVNTASSFLVP